MLLAVAYSLLVMTTFGSTDGGFDSLSDVRTLFASDEALCAGWLHYLAFDLLVGVWLARRMDETSVSRIIQAPVLAATFMFGPVGWLMGVLTIYFMQRSARLSEGWERPA